jgi:hypothetical protein
MSAPDVAAPRAAAVYLIASPDLVVPGSAA